MYSKLRALIPVLIMSLTLSGCGDLLGQKVVKRSLGSGIAELTCELDMNKFSEIMNQNIESQIRCLGESLNLFIRVVKSGKPGYLSRVQLEKYLALRPDVKPEVVKALGSVFNLGHLITGEDPNFISKSTIDKVIKFALVFNQEAALNFGPIFQNESPSSYSLHLNHRDRVTVANKAIIQALRLIFNPNRNGEIHKINIIELLESFSTETNRHQVEKAKKVLFLKKVLFGGENEILTHTELEKLILNFDHLLLIGLDITRYSYISLSQETTLQLLKRDVNDLFEIVTQGPLNNRDPEVLFTIDQAVEATKLFIEKDEFDIDKYKNLIGEIKKIAMKGNSVEVKGGELKNLFTHAKSILQSGTVFHRIYDKFKDQLKRPVPVDIDFSEYRHTYPEHQNELDQFERIVKNYRFMKGAELRYTPDNTPFWFTLPTPFYAKEYHRNANAVFETALFEYGLKLVFSTYGSPSPNGDAVGGFSIDKDQMQKLVKKFEPELIELDLLTPQRATGTADNISLLGSLFQYQSDQNKVMDVNEATEFGITLFSSLNVAKSLHESFMKENCPVDDFKRIEPACFKKYFWKGFCTHYREYYPLMFQSVNAPAKCSDFVINEKNAAVYERAVQLLDRSTLAARSCNQYTDGEKEEIHYSEGDMMTIVLAMIHVETTILRWDINNNNFMDANEVNNAYAIYSPALDGFLEGKNAIIKKFKKQIYQYMIKYEQVPDEKDFGSIWKFVKFLLSFNKKSPADRKTIASILVAIGNENAKLQTGQVFDCNLLRDPDNIPNDPLPAQKPVLNALKSEADFQVSSIPATLDLVNSYGAERRGELKDEMLALSDDMEAGFIKKVKDIKQHNLKYIITKILANSAEMKRIHALMPEGSDIDKVGFMISIVLLDEKIY